MASSSNRTSRSSREAHGTEVNFPIAILRIGLAGFFNGEGNSFQIINQRIRLKFKDADSQEIVVDIPYKEISKFYACRGLETMFITLSSGYIPQFLNSCKFCKHTLLDNTDNKNFYERCILIRSAIPIPSHEFNHILRGFGDPEKIKCIVMQLVNDACLDLLKECGATFVNSIWTFNDPCPADKRYPSCCFPPGDHVEETSQSLSSDEPSAKRCRTIDQPAEDVIIVSEQSTSSSVVPFRKPASNKIRDFYYKPTFCNNGIKIRDKDFNRLSDRHSHMCDTVIDFYMMYINYEMLSPTDRNRIHVFNSFFYTGLKNAVKESPSSRNVNSESMKWRHARVAKWTKNVNIFSKDFIIIPVNEDDHWALAIICFPWMVGEINYRQLFSRNSSTSNYSINPLPTSKESVYAEKRRKLVEEVKRTHNIEPMPCILMLDSLIGSFARAPNVEMLRHYLQVEWNERRLSTDGTLNFDKVTIRGFQPKVPQQPNLHDCGIYVMQYMESFFKKPITSFKKEYFETMNKWFPLNVVLNKRESIRQLIIQKYQESVVTTSGDNS